MWQRLKKNHPPWIDAHTKAIQNMKQKIKCIPCLSLPYPNTLKIVEMDAFELGYEGILKQNIDNKDKIIRYYSCLGKPTQ